MGFLFGFDAIQEIGFARGGFFLLYCGIDCLRRGDVLLVWRIVVGGRASLGFDSAGFEIFEPALTFGEKGRENGC